MSQPVPGAWLDNSRRSHDDEGGGNSGGGDDGEDVDCIGFWSSRLELVCVALDTGHDASLMANEMQKQSKASWSLIINDTGTGTDTSTGLRPGIGIWHRHTHRPRPGIGINIT